MKNPKPFLEFAWRIELTLGVMQTFSVDHPRVAEPLAGALGAFRDLVSGKLEIQIVAAPGRLFINDEPLDVSTDINLAHLHDQMTERGVAGVVFGRDLNLEELRALLGLLAMHPHKALAQGGASGILGRARVRHIKLAEVRYDAGYSPYLEALDAQRNMNDAQLAMIRNCEARLAAAVDLFKALGGGWSGRNAF